MNTNLSQSTVLRKGKLTVLKYFYQELPNSFSDSFEFCSPPSGLATAGLSDKAKVWWSQRGRVKKILSTQNIVSARHSMLVISRLDFISISANILLGLKWGSQLSAFNYFEGQLSLINRTLPLRDTGVTISPFRLWTS